MREQLAKPSRGHDLAKAFNYILKRWASFTLFLEDGRVCLSNKCSRTGFARHRSWPEVLAVLRIGSRRAARRGHVQPDRHGQNERRRPASLAGRRPCSHRCPPGSSAGRASALELVPGINILRSSGMTTHVNKVHHVTTVTQVAKDLGEDEDWLRDISIEME